MTSASTPKPIPPSTQWRERIAADEAERYAEYAKGFAALQQDMSRRYGVGRGLHRQAHLGLVAELEVLPHLPPAARQGLFAEAGRHPAWVRLSNGGPDRKPDHRSDIRGFSIKVQGLSGPGALGGEADCQDFLLIDRPNFGFPTAEEFVGTVLSAVKGPGPLVKHLMRRYGLMGGLRWLRRLSQSRKKPFSGFTSESFHSAAPIACGPYAAKVRLTPLQPAPASAAQGAPDWAGEVRSRLAGGPLVFALELQFFVSEEETPIEDASKTWPESVAPFVTVARLSIPPQDLDAPAGRALAEAIEAAAFDPWRALAAHRPLGDVMRARKVVYYQSQLGRAPARTASSTQTVTSS